MDTYDLIFYGLACWALGWLPAMGFALWITRPRFNFTMNDSDYPRLTHPPSRLRGLCRAHGAGYRSHEGRAIIIGRGTATTRTARSRC